jgi:triacylglycerol lipase
MWELLLWLAGLLLVGTGLQTFAFYAIWFYEQRVSPELAEVPGGSPVRWWQALLGAMREWLSITALVVSYPLRLLHDASPVKNRRPGEEPIILVHGYGGDSANFLLMQWRLKRRGWRNVYAVSYTPPIIDARKLAQQVADHVDAVLRVTRAEKAHLICHSMGGPLARYALHHLGLAGRVGKVITLGSPHAGSRVANLFPAIGAAFQMRYQSAFIRELNALGEPPGDTRFYSIYSNFDNFILPASSAVLPGAGNIHVPLHGHCALLYSARVLDEVEACLRGTSEQSEPAEESVQEH